jgi:hypothetical protein
MNGEKKGMKFPELLGYANISSFIFHIFCFESPATHCTRAVNFLFVCLLLLTYQEAVVKFALFSEREGGVRVMCKIRPLHTTI